MAAVDEKIASNAFSVITSLDPAAIRAAGSRAGDSAKSFLKSSVREASTGPSFAKYVIKGPGGLVTQMELTVRWQDSDDGTRQVRLEIGQYLTVRQTFMFIPLTPKQAPALSSLRTFSTRLREELAR